MTGDVLPRLTEREFSLFEGTHYQVSETGCWDWIGYRNPQGYGMCRSGIAGEKRAHRAAYVLANGPIEGGHVHHKCENKSCINPDHLEHRTASNHISMHVQERSTLTLEDVREIRAARAAGAKVLDLSDRYGIAWGTLWPLLRNLTWVDPEYVPGVERTCGECGATFHTTKVNKRFCDRSCRVKWTARTGGRRRRGQNPDGSETRGYRKAA